MSAREDILNNVRANRATAIDLPSLDQDWQTFDDPLDHFRQMLTGIGASSEVMPNAAAADAWLNDRSEYAKSASAISLVEGVGRSTLQLDQLATPHELSGLDWAVLPGEFGVAENGAIWITDHQIRYRAVYFLCEHLVLVLPTSQVLHNMPQAYERIAGWGTDDRPAFGTFVAGPSKTADIEQSLVIGAQGPRSLDVLLIDA
ncbi:LutC/YkgG family protein [Aeoliella sp.]|uniref:LutC/YkgG family protein n=1 Tax=Aeoliella sp. TaxID=2795800 RepID=UPI003CCBBE1F